MIINSYIHQQASSYEYLIDDYPASIAYSLRLLSSTYSGALVKIRRSSDDAVKDFYPDDDNVLSMSSEDGSGTSLSTWISTDSGYIDTWYDQEGNYDITQATTSRQPTIVSAGTLVTNPTNGLAAIDTTSSLTGLYASTFTTALTQPLSVALIVEYKSLADSSADCTFDGDHTTSESKITFRHYNSQNYVYAGAVGNLNTQDLDYHRFLFLFDGTTSLEMKDGTTSSTYNAGTAGATSINLGSYRAYGSTKQINAYLQEFILWDGDESGNFTDIDSNLSYWD